MNIINYTWQKICVQNFNQYGYVLNNPLKYTDPSGNKFKLTFSDIVAGLEIAVGAVMVALAPSTFGATGALIYFGGKAIYEYSSGNTLFTKPNKTR